MQQAAAAALTSAAREMPKTVGDALGHVVAAYEVSQPALLLLR